MDEYERQTYIAQTNLFGGYYFLVSTVTFLFMLADSSDKPDKSVPLLQVKLPLSLSLSLSIMCVCHTHIN